MKMTSGVKGNKPEMKMTACVNGISVRFRGKTRRECGEILSGLLDVQEEPADIWIHPYIEDPGDLGSYYGSFKHFVVTEAGIVKLQEFFGDDGSGDNVLVGRDVRKIIASRMTS